MRVLLYLGVFILGLLGTLGLLKSLEDTFFGPGPSAGGFAFAAVCLVLAERALRAARARATRPVAPPESKANLP